MIQKKRKYTNVYNKGWSVCGRQLNVRSVRVSLLITPRGTMLSAGNYKNFTNFMKVSDTDCEKLSYRRRIFELDV